MCFPQSLMHHLATFFFHLHEARVQVRRRRGVDQSHPVSDCTVTRLERSNHTICSPQVSPTNEGSKTSEKIISFFLAAQLQKFSPSLGLPLGQPLTLSVRLSAASDLLNALFIARSAALSLPIVSGPFSHQTVLTDRIVCVSVHLRL